MEDEVKTFSMCCGGARCPVTMIQKDQWVLRDDFGGEVKLTKEQVEEFIEKAQEHLDSE